jgi:branched-chain amino acid transport system substrate-binding protein
VLNDQSGLYADVTGPGSVVAPAWRSRTSGLAEKGWKIDVVVGDHQNKPDVGVNIARQWFDATRST